MRNEVRSLMHDVGLPSFFITINPADCCLPLVQFIAGRGINMSKLLPEHGSNYWGQSVLVAENPFIAARLFDDYVRAFISHILDTMVRAARSSLGFSELSRVVAVALRPKEEERCAVTCLS